MARDTGHTASEEERLRGDIDSGQTGEKVAAIDPAAAPLGADAEAGGVRTDQAAVARDRLEQETGRETAGVGATAVSAEPKHGPRFGTALIVLAAVLVLAALWVLLV
ncbi:hypothetical protein [Pseudohoeflea coraliihabitans]|uniref:Uncharacterized protein n=1 Tax=Pseudohoeflea coraliihabitans TaxID=2860393 RepID=A0ABS6WQV5_9HYPH|nr:hypothetical protein [Pseudohoeflea sp. DP4N28-3]MBW3098357.1 hypothetical protein [Pseudohoeflea sp. DP4N28-3]